MDPQLCVLLIVSCIALGVYLADRLGYHATWCSGITTRQLLILADIGIGIIMPVVIPWVLTGSPLWLILVPFLVILQRSIFAWGNHKYQHRLDCQKFEFAFRDWEDQEAALHDRCYIDDHG